MPLTAIDVSTGDQIVICEDFDRARHAHLNGGLACPYCDTPIVPVREHMRMGDWVTAYVRHRATDPCTTDYRYHTESPEHLAAKYYIGRTAAKEFGYKDATCVYELRMPEIKRIADVCFILPNGSHMVHEAQLSATSPDELEERTNDYQSLGYGIIWHFGKAANTEVNKRWAFRRLGGCAGMDFGESIESSV